MGTKSLKLGKRLKQLESMVGTGYEHIWDCCCDHGLLGAALLSRQVAPHIHFVDRVPDLMHKLEAGLMRFFPSKTTDMITQENLVSQWHIHCIDVALLPLTQNPGKQLVIIAGVGGDLMTGFINAIYQQHPTLEIDFLLCPVHHNFTLRKQLIAYSFHLKHEVLVEENQRIYEVLLVTKNPDGNTPISPAGSKIWETNNDEQARIARDYLQKTLAHYQKMQLRPGVDVQHIIDAYKTIEMNPMYLTPPK